MNNIKTTGKRVLAVMVTVVMIFTATAVQQTGTAKAASAKYWLKVNAQRGVVTAYKYSGGKWKPVRAMLASVGKASTPTVMGTYSMGYKNRWRKIGGPDMGGYSYGQYVCQITGGYLFHSVWYYTRSKRTQSSSEFNKLGRPASHGCVRLATIDAKWIYDHCKSGTKITVYKSSKAGPLGKPKALKSHSGWDPTDPTKGNPNFKLRKAVIKVKKARTVQYGSSYKLLKGVTASNPNANENLTGRVKVYSVKKWNNSKKKYYKAELSTQKLGTYKITYRVKYGYCRTGYKTIKVRVIDTATPSISNAANRTVAAGSSNAVGSVTAKQKSRSLTSRMKVYITAPGETSATAYTYSQAKAYTFSKEGTYTVKYYVKNVYKPYRAASKTVTFTSKLSSPQISQSSSPTVNAADTRDTVETAIRQSLTIKGAGGATGNADNAGITLSGTWNVTGPQTATVTYTGYEGPVTQTVNYTVQ
ncbi:MAG: L,D-transpeptidase [Eubacteriaceae bacterium]|nr:L,D-transpeptidase [Eubacteriaceae bacterium]